MVRIIAQMGAVVLVLALAVGIIAIAVLNTRPIEAWVATIQAAQQLMVGLP